MTKHIAVVPKLFRAVAQIKVSIVSYYPQKFSHFRSKISFAVIAHNAEQQCGFGFMLPQEKSHITSER